MGMHTVLTLRAPLAVQFEPTYKCNNHCVFCYNVWKGSNRPRTDAQYNHLDLAEVCAVLDHLKSAGVFQVSLTGGEPTLRKDLPDIVAHGCSVGLSMSMVSNGVLITSELADSLAQAGLRRTQVSMHGPNPELHDSLTRVPGSFSGLLRGASALTNAGISTSVNMTVCKRNVSRIAGTARVAADIGANSFSITRFIPSGEGRDTEDSLSLDVNDLERILDQLDTVEEEFKLRTTLLTPFPLCSLRNPARAAYRMARCDGGLSWCVITPEDRVRYCTNLDCDAGDLMTRGLHEIWQNAPIFRRARALELLPAACRDCAAYPLCGGGCRACGANAAGCVDGADPCSNISRSNTMGEQMPALMAEVARRLMPTQVTALADLSLSLEYAPYVLRGTVFREEDFGYIMTVTARSYSVLNDQGKAILSRCDGRTSLGQIIDDLVAEYPEEKDKVQHTVQAFFRQLSLRKLIGWRRPDSVSNERNPEGTCVRPGP